MNVLKINNYDLTHEESLQLKADVAAAATTIVVDGISGISSGDYLVLEYGNGNGEIVSVSATPTTTTVSVSALKYAHKKNISIVKMPYNQIRVYSAISKSGTYALVTSVASDVDQLYTIYSHSAGASTTWYKVTFYNSTSLAETAISNSTAFKAGITIDAAPMSQFANSYVTVDMADDYFQDKFQSEKWFEQTDMDKARLLIEATRRIEAFPFYGNSIWERQKLHFPIWQDNETMTGTPQSGTTTSLVDANRASDTERYNDYWNYGGMRITDGTNEHEVRMVSDYAHSTGTFTIADAFSAVIDTTSDYLVSEAVPKEIRDAVCETAFWLIDNYNNHGRDPSVSRERLSDGYEIEYFGASETASVPKEAYSLVARFINRIGEIRVV